MNREEIIRIAREADLVTWGFESLEWEPVASMEAIERFAALVASAERESLRESFRVVTAAEASAAILHERDACAQECEHTAVRMGSEWMAHHCAAAIRARGQA